MRGGTVDLSKTITAALTFFEHLGGVGELIAKTAIGLFKRPIGFGEILRQVDQIGVQSMAVAVLTAIFSSMVITVQLAVQLARFGSREHIGNVVGLSLVRELGPVLTALMVGGRVGAGIAAEIGSMTVTEQVDAIRSMGADPVKKLVVPRTVAMVIVLPLLTTLSDILGVTGAMFIAGFQYNVTHAYFFHSLLRSVRLYDFAGGIIKTVFFGFFIAIISCHLGLSTRGGTEGVGKSTTQAVVFSSIITLISDFILTSILIELGF
jgi:phospholipid/cholesterol/gamma-HCH transport system permease protein